MIEIYCKNNNLFKTVQDGLTLLEISKLFDTGLKGKPLCALVNNRLQSLGYKVYSNTDVEYLDSNDSFGALSYACGAIFILAKAVMDLFGEEISVNNPVSNGIYCLIDSERELKASDVDAISRRMKEIVSMAYPFEMHHEHSSKVAEIMNSAGREDVARLISNRRQVYTTYYTLDGMPDIFQCCLPPDTSYITLYHILFFHGGILLRTPDREHPDRLYDIVRQDKMLDIFKEYHSWQDIMGMSTVADFNETCTDSRHTKDLINVAEALQAKKIVHIADAIQERRANGGKLKLILISGPSSSGKTTFSKRLQVQLMAYGLTPKVISLDNYFVDQVNTPRDATGDYDFESLYALDLELFNKQTAQLLAGETVELPTYNFHTGKQEFRGNKMCLEENDILLMEGIHALNPELTPSIPQECKFLIYVSALTTLRIDQHNYIKTTDNRLLRRILRDYSYRSYSARNTIARWPSVRAGEDKWIFPYQENADAMFNSALLFEIPVLRSLIEPILTEVPQDCREYAKAHQLLEFLGTFKAIPSGDLPPTSLLREFIGGSSFHY